MRTFTPKLCLFALAVLVSGGTAFSAPQHSADTNADFSISLSELLRVIQFFNSAGFSCLAGTEDGYSPGTGDQSCTPHDSDYQSQDWIISLSELLRLIQFFNSDGYHCGIGSEDDYATGPGDTVNCRGGEGEGEGEGEVSLAPFSVTVDTGIVPAITSLPPLAGGDLRPVGAIVGETGHQAEFVLNELLLVTADTEILNAFLLRWGGDLIETYDPADAGLSGDPVHVVRITPGLATTDNLAADVLALDPDARGASTVSSEEGLRLLAAAAREAADGLQIGVVWVARGASIANRSTDEGDTGPAGFNDSGAAYVDNAFDWHFLNKDSVQDIGVTEAWYLLEKTEHFSNKVKIAILDMGFVDTDDLPKPFVAYSNVPFVSAMNQSNLGSCGGPCPWHGTGVAGTAFGLPDNNSGAAGVAGPVATPLLIFTSYDYATGINAVLGAVASGARVINMSYSVPVPAAFAWTVAPFELTTLAASTTAVLFAAAGNDSENVDARDCFITCWEESLWTPCENSGVECVGGLGFNSKNNDPGSNFGTRGGVDIWAPYTVLVGPDGANTTDQAYSASGTSVSSPYMAGVAGLILAADPALSPGQVRDILYSTARVGNGPYVQRYVDAYAAVSQALGSQVIIEVPADGFSISRGSTLNFQAFVLEGGRGAPTITWSSNLDGTFGSGVTPSISDLSFGTHIITATATWAGGVTRSDTINLTIENDPPILTIEQPVNGAGFFQSQQINLNGTAFDVNNPPGYTLTAEQVLWRIDGNPIGTGFTQTIAPDTLSVGDHTIRFEGNDGSASGFDEVAIWVAANNVDLPPNIVNITSPAAGYSDYADQFDDLGWYKAVTLSGNASDLEDGPVPGSRLKWTTRINGGPLQALGTGSSLNVKLYAPDGFANEHRITLQARDSTGHASETSITVTINLLAK